MARTQKAERKRVANVLGAFALALTDKMNAAVRDAGNCSDMASAAIIQIGFEPGLSIERLRSCLGLSHSATVRVVDQLQAEGLAKRERNPQGDSRVALLTLTVKGEAQMRETLAARDQIVEPILARLSSQEATSLLAILEKAMPAVVEPGADQDVVCRLCDLNACPQDTCPVLQCGAEH